MGREDLRRIKSRQYTRSCPRKNDAGKPYRRYPTRTGAYLAFIRLEEKLAKQGLPPPLDIYQCHLCFGWHISTQGQRSSEGGESVNGEKGQEEGQPDQGKRETREERQI